MEDRRARMYADEIRRLSEIAAQRPLTADEAMALVFTPDDESFEALLDGAEQLRRAHRGDEVTLCAIVNAKSGHCGEDCKFCAQSAHYETDTPEYAFIGREKILEAAHRAKALGAREFSTVVAGKKIRKNELEELTAAIPDIIRETGLAPCGSLGVVGDDELARLREAGMTMFHHNLETAESHYGEICTTRPYSVNVESVKAAKRQGMFVCSGGIFGMGETWAQRVELLLLLRDLDVDSVPINFLNPRPGTPFAEYRELTSRDALKIIALARHILPAKQVLVCGGREVNLGDDQKQIFRAGASGMMIGDYLTTKGRGAAADHAMIEELGLRIRPCESHGHDESDAPRTAPAATESVTRVEFISAKAS